MRLLLLFTLGSIGAVLSGAERIGYASAESDREAVQTIAQSLLQLQRPDEAIQLLTEFLKEDPKDASAWKLLGFLYLEKKNGPQARLAFLEAAKVSVGTQKAIAIYHQARASQLAGLYSESGQLLASIQGTRSLRESVKRAQTSLASSETIEDLELTPPMRGYLTASLQAGLDTNVLLMSNTTLLTTAQGETQSVVTHGSVMGGLTLPWHSTLDLKGTLGSQFLFPWNTAAKAFRGLMPLLEFGPTWTRSTRAQDSWLSRSLEHGLKLHADALFLNTSGLGFFFSQLSLHHDGDLKLHPRWKLRSELILRYQIFALSEGQSESTIRSGPGIRGRLLGDLLGNFGQISAGVEAEIHQAIGVEYRSRMIGGFLNAQLNLPWSLLFQPEVGYAYTPFPVSSTLRSDRSLRLLASLSRQFGSRFTVSLSWSSQLQESTLESANFKRHQGLLGIQYAFL